MNNVIMYNWNARHSRHRPHIFNGCKHTEYTICNNHVQQKKDKLSSNHVNVTFKSKVEIIQYIQFHPEQHDQSQGRLTVI